jgi:dsRNA-specific ribonuclease
MDSSKINSKHFLDGRPHKRLSNETSINNQNLENFGFFIVNLTILANLLKKLPNLQFQKIELKIYKEKKTH